MKIQLVVAIGPADSQVPVDRAGLRGMNGQSHFACKSASGRKLTSSSGAERSPVRLRHNGRVSIGITLVTCTATDSFSNFSTATFNVTVVKALQITATFDRSGTVDPITGIATVSGTATCSRSP
jgi:hypothetical protein